MTELQIAEDLIRHFADLRDGTHGGVGGRAGKEALFRTAVRLLDPYATGVLTEFGTRLLAGRGRVEASGVVADPRGLTASWTLTWAEQERAGVGPIALIAHFGAGFHHPHLRGFTIGEWPLNVFTEADARRQVPLLQVIAAGDLHNLVFESDYRIVPVTGNRNETGDAGGGPTADR